MPKSYSKFKLEDLEALGLTIMLSKIFMDEEILPLEPSDFFKSRLERGLKRNLGTEKAKSENITSPILCEIEDLNEKKIAIYSGYTFNIDNANGLKGECDFIGTKNPKSYIIDNPIFCVVQALRDNLDDAMAQCVAQMYAAQIYTKKRHNQISTIYGATTSGTNWKFARLTENQVEIDYFHYSLSELPKLLGVLNYIVNQ